MDFLSYVKENKERLIERTKHLLRFKSVLDHFDPNSSAPFGEAINDALTWFLKMAHDDGFVTKNIEGYAGHIEVGEGEDLLGILCHLDVVPPGEGWSHDPFDPIIKDDKLYARGSMDDKGPTMAAYMAVLFLKELGVEFHKRIRIILGTDEETGWRGIREYFKIEEMPSIGFAPDASFPLIYGEKGLYSFDLEGQYQNDELVEFYCGERYNVVPDYAECILNVDLKEPFMQFLAYHGFEGEIKGNKYIVHGKNAHAMTPHLGVNAGFILAQFLNENINNPYIRFIQEKLSFDPYAEKLGIECFDEETKHFTLNVGIFRYNQDQVLLGLNARYPRNYDFEDSEEKIIKKAKKYKLSYRLKTNMPPHYVDPNDDLVKVLYEVYKTYTGDTQSKPFTIGGGTYARALDKGVAFGMMMPGRKDVAHQADEHLFLDDFIISTAIYMEAIYRLTRA